MRIGTINNICYPHDAAEFKRLWNIDAVFALNVVSHIIVKLALVEPSVNKQRAAMMGAPRSVLDVLKAVHDQPSPRLLYRKCSIIFQSRRPSCLHRFFHLPPFVCAKQRRWRCAHSLNFRGIHMGGLTKITAT